MIILQYNYKKYIMHICIRFIIYSILKLIYRDYNYYYIICILFSIYTIHIPVNNFNTYLYVCNYIIIHIYDNLRIKIYNDEIIC